MFDILKKEIDWGGRKLTLETGRIARQADGAVLATYGETTVLCTAVSQKEPKRGIDFFPLTVNYQEKSFAAGKIPGGFFKREGRPSEKETLTSRLIDRPIRPLFHPQFRNETQVICTVLCHDPIGGARVGYVDGEYVLNPQVDEMPASALDLMVAGTQDGVLMVESEAKELTEEVMLGAVMFGHREIQPVIDAIIEMAETAAKEPWNIGEAPPEHAIVAGRVKDLADSGLREAYKAPDKTIPPAI
jgi:polyribonucleotide nucleotidyltransferase